MHAPVSTLSHDFRDVGADRDAALDAALDEANAARTMVFCKTANRAAAVAERLAARGVAAAPYTKDVAPERRLKTLDLFAGGELAVPFCVETSRGGAAAATWIFQRDDDRDGRFRRRPPVYLTGSGHAFRIGCCGSSSHIVMLLPSQNLEKGAPHLPGSSQKLHVVGATSRANASLRISAARPGNAGVCAAASSTAAYLRRAPVWAERRAASSPRLSSPRIVRVATAGVRRDSSKTYPRGEDTR